jgi:trehalose 6-phosphate synthase
VNIVVVSNRVARVTPNEPIAGGLAAALLPAVKAHGAVWVGSSGELQDSARDAFAEIQALGKGALATVDMPERHYRGFYEGFANSALWPVLHSRADLISVSREDYVAYREVNAYMARSLLRFCQPDASYWIQDYHFLTLGRELRKLGVTQPVGFFLHTPWPARSLFVALPGHREIVEAMLDYDLIGFQTKDDETNFADYVQAELGWRLRGGRLIGPNGICRIGTFPIGIDVEQFASQSLKASGCPDVIRLRASLQDSQLIIGVDREDYSKGLNHRIQAFDRLLEREPAFKRRLSFLQIAVPSRTGIATYNQIHAELATAVGEVNGRHGEVDWTPIRYLNKGYSQASLSGFYRTARIGLVTPLYDGMNLVAKEYIAAQNPSDPGVLVLSQFAGAAKELDAALLVNPHDIDGISRSITMAARMSQSERCERWLSLMDSLQRSSVHFWFADFVRSLAATRSAERRKASAPPLAPSAPSLAEKQAV